MTGTVVEASLRDGLIKSLSKKIGKEAFLSIFFIFFCFCGRYPWLDLMVMVMLVVKLVVVVVMVLVVLLAVVVMLLKIAVGLAVVVDVGGQRI